MIKDCFGFVGCCQTLQVNRCIICYPFEQLNNSPVHFMVDYLDIKQQDHFGFPAMDNQQPQSQLALEINVGCLHGANMAPPMAIKHPC